MSRVKKFSCLFLFFKNKMKIVLVRETDLLEEQDSSGLHYGADLY